MKFEKINKNVYLRFFISYIVILLIPIIAVLFAFSKSIMIAEQDVKEYSLLMLEQSKNTVDSKITELDNMVQQISLNTKITTLVDKDRSLENTQFDYFSACKELKNFKLTNDFVDSIYLVLKNEDILISDEFAVRDLPFFYEVNLKYGNMEYQDWHNGLWDKYYHSNIIPSTAITRNYKQENIITYMQSLPVGGVNTNHGVIIILIKENEFKKYISPISKQGSWAYIADEKGEMITSSSNGANQIIPPKDLKGPRLKNENLLMQYTVSKINNWTYAAAYPLSTIMSRVNYIKTIILVVILIAALGGIFAALLFSNNNSKPINQLLDKNNKLNESMKSKLPILRSAFMDRLLKGGFNTQEEINIAFSSLEMSFDYPRYLVVLIKVNGYKHINDREQLSKLNMAKILVLEESAKIADESIQMHELEGDKIAILFSFKDTEQNEIQQRIELFADKTYQSLINSYKIYLSYGAGSVCNSLLEVYKSYYEAKEAIEYNIAEDGKYVTWYEKVSSKVSNYYYYPIEIENKIINLVRAGDVNQISNILDELYIENIKNRVLSKLIVKFLIDDMKGTVVKTISQIKHIDKELGSVLVEEISSAGSTSSIEEFMIKLKDVYSNLCKKPNYSKSGELKDKLHGFMDSHYQEPDLNLYLAATQFEMNEKYFSRLFKEITGTTFSQYLEEKRLSVAKDLLDKTDFTINDISEKVGYTSAHAFRRAFKRVYGVLPTACRVTDAELQVKL